MIGIEVNGKFLTLKSGSNIRFEKNFFSLEQEIFQGDYSFPFDIPADDNNLSILGVLTQIENSKKVLKYNNVQIYLFDIPWQKASLIVLSNNKNSIKINLTAGIKSINSAGKSLKDLNWGQPIYLGKFPEDIAQTCTTIANEATYELHGYTFVPHKNLGFYGDSNPDFLGTINMVNPNTGLMYHNTISTGNKYTLVPFLYLHFILAKIFEEEGLQPQGNFWTNPEMQKLLVYNNHALDSLNEIGETKIKTITHQDIYQANFTGSFPYKAKSNFIKGPSGTYDEPFAFNNTTHEYTITQQGLYTLDFNGHIFLQRGTSLAYGFFLDNNWIGGIFPAGVSQGEHFYVFSTSYNASVADIGKKITCGFAWFNLLPSPVTTVRWGYIATNSEVTIKQKNEDNLNLYSRNLVLKNHVKDIPVEEFLLAVKKLGIDFEFDYINKKVTVNFITDTLDSKKTIDFTGKAYDNYEVNYDNYKRGYKVSYDFGSTDKLNDGNFINVDFNSIQGEVNTIQELPVISNAGTLFFIRNLNQFWISAYDQYASPQYFWKKHSDYYFTSTFENAENEVKLTFAPMLMGMGKNIPPVADADKETALMPESNCQGSSEMFNLGDNDFDLRLCFFRGQNVVRSTPLNKGGNYLFANTTIYGLNGNLVGDYDLTLHTDNGFWKRFLYDLYVKISSGEIYEQDFSLDELDIINIAKAVKINVDGNIFLTKSVSIIISNILKASRIKMLKL